MSVLRKAHSELSRRKLNKFINFFNGGLGPRIEGFSVLQFINIEIDEDSKIEGS